MKTTHLIPLGLLTAALAVPGYAATTPEEHAAHQAAPAKGTGTAKAHAGKNGTHMRKMDSQTDAMKAMHEKMVAAKTPEEKNALMSEHMKTMGAGMAMMKEMPKGMGDMKSANGMAEHHVMMEKRMAMMAAAMDMMSDRLPQPAK
ncbi:hypothetical protein WG902_03680 [Ramlibacter sp. PS3R-8]|uniref:hypothetical protein n=1 Tax=Ramlibacter sp. PS3R-8 TaxID=3133437 RepID=UPI0030A482BB